MLGLKKHQNLTDTAVQEVRSKKAILEHLAEDFPGLLDFDGFTRQFEECDSILDSIDPLFKEIIH
jgi:hypothetical protein